jgi:hypothetical protein
MIALMPLSPNGPSRARDTLTEGGRLARIRRAATELTPEAIDQIAQRLADVLEQRAEQRSTPSAGLVGVAELAHHLSVTRAWVYQHASELGAIRIGTGPRARLRFDLEAAKEVLARAETSSSAVPKGRPPRRQPPYSPTAAVPRLPVTPRRVRGFCTGSARIASGQLS